MNPLQAELETYNKCKDELVAKGEGKFVLIRADRVAGMWDTYEDALQAGYNQFGLEPFLVKRIQRIDRVQFFTRDIPKCRA